MHVHVHPAVNMLRGDEGYNARELEIHPLPNGAELLTGTFKDDGRPSGTPGRPDRRFHITLPVGFDDWQHLNQRVFHALRHDAGDVVITV